MANDTGGLFQTLVAATSLATQELRYQNAFLSSMFWDYKPYVVTPHTGLNVIIPTVDESDVVDIQSGPLQPADTKHTNVQIPFNVHFSTSWTVKVWDEIRSPVALKDKYVKPKLEGLRRKINRYVSQLVTTSNFSSYTIVSGSGADIFQRADLTSAWVNLANAGVNTEDTGNVFLITSPTAYGGMIGDSNFINQYIVGTSAAEMAQQQAKLKLMYGAEIRYDQHIAKYNANKEPGLLYHRYAIAGVTADYPTMGDPGIHETQLPILQGSPLKAQMQMQATMKDQGWLVNLHCWFGVKIARPELGATLQTA